MEKRTYCRPQLSHYMTWKYLRTKALHRGPLAVCHITDCLGQCVRMLKDIKRKRV